MTHDAIIEALGGYRAVADAIGAAHSSVWRWRRHGIPTSRWAAIVALAQKQRADITLATLAARYERKTAEAA